jgi:hypothetical protein
MKKTGGKIVLAIVVLGFFSLGLRLDNGVTQKPLAGPTNIYVSDSLLLISDSSTGIHIYSVKNQQSPVFKQRIPLGGNTGIAMKGNVLYANSFGRILAMTITGDATYEISSVIKEDPYWNRTGYTTDYNNTGWGCENTQPVAYSSGTSGTGGSYAVFAVIDSFLYYIDNAYVITMDISQPDKPVKLKETFVDWSIETLCPTQKYLYVGSSSGMYILDRSNPVSPVQVGMVTHFRARDPVVVQDTIAYVTLRQNWDWWVSQDELMTVNVKDPALADSIAVKRLLTPYGLAVSDTLLYVAQGTAGYCLLDVKDPAAVTTIQTWMSPPAKDFIWIGNRLYLMGFTDVRIYDVTNPASPVLLSTIQ